MWNLNFILIILGGDIFAEFNLNLMSLSMWLAKTSLRSLNVLITAKNSHWGHGRGILLTYLPNPPHPWNHFLLFIFCYISCSNMVFFAKSASQQLRVFLSTHPLLLLFFFFLSYFDTFLTHKYFFQLLFLVQHFWVSKGYFHISNNPSPLIFVIFSTISASFLDFTKNRIQFNFQHFHTYQIHRIFLA